MTRWLPLVFVAFPLACYGTTVTLYSYSNPIVAGGTATVEVTITGNAPPVPGNVTFTDNGKPASCQNSSFFAAGVGNALGYTCQLPNLAQGQHVIGATYNGDAKNPPASTSLVQKVTGTLPSTGIVTRNPYGNLTVTGSQLIGNIIVPYDGWTDIYLGPNPGAPGDALEVEFATFDMSNGQAITIHSGAPGQIVLFRVTGSAPSALAATIFSVASDPQGTVPPAAFYFANPNGISVPGNSILGVNDVVLDALGSSWNEGAPITIEGTVSAWRVEVRASSITGPGFIVANDLVVRTFGNMNDPRFPGSALDNGFKILAANAYYPLNLTLNAYGEFPQFINLKVLSAGGNVVLQSPSVWPAGSAAPANNIPVLPRATRPASTPEPSYGGGSLVVQVTDGWLHLASGASNDFVYPGALALVSSREIDTAGVVIDHGWTTSGRTFQGLFFDAPKIFSSVGDIEAYSNAQNWINFSTLPLTPVRTFQLVAQPGGGAAFAAADHVAPHLNSYVTISRAAANGECWVCLVDGYVVDVAGTQ